METGFDTCVVKSKGSDLVSCNCVCFTVVVKRKLFLAGIACSLMPCSCNHRTLYTDSEAKTPLTVAAEKGDVERVTKLLGGKEHVNDADKDGYTALHRASHCGNVRVVKTLIAAGANVNAKTKQNVTPLLISIDMMCPTPEVTMALIEAGADVNAAEDGGDTAIVIASTESTIDVMKELLKRGANPDAQGQGGGTALHYAAMNNLEDRTEILLQAGARIDIANNAGKTALDVGMPDTKRLIEKFVKATAKNLGKYPRFKGPYRVAPGEAYKGSPIIKYSVNPDGTVSNVRLIRSSGIRDLDEKLVRAYSGWRFRAQRGRPVIEAETSVLIHWGE
jgi:TonB family protein